MDVLCLSIRKSGCSNLLPKKLITILTISRSCSEFTRAWGGVVPLFLALPIGNGTMAVQLLSDLISRSRIYSAVMLQEFEVSGLELGRYIEPNYTSYCHGYSHTVPAATHSRYDFPP